MLIVRAISFPFGSSRVFGSCVISPPRSDLHPLPLPPDLMETRVHRFLETGGSGSNRRGRGEGRFDGIHLPAGVHARRAGPAGGCFAIFVGSAGVDSSRPRVNL